MWRKPVQEGDVLREKKHVAAIPMNAAIGYKAILL
jgi:hypothetical protein